MAKYKFVNEDENKNKLAFKDLNYGDIFLIIDKECLDKFTKSIANTPKMRVDGFKYGSMIDVLTGKEYQMIDIDYEVKKYTGTLIFDGKDWTDKK